MPKSKSRNAHPKSQAQSAFERAYFLTGKGDLAGAVKWTRLAAQQAKIAEQLALIPDPEPEIDVDELRRQLEYRVLHYQREPTCEYERKIAEENAATLLEMEAELAAEGRLEEYRANQAAGWPPPSKTSFKP